ncbi:thioredoxin family protein [Tolumonas osonensis]|uniref:Thioredoxin 1 n=1 Tax=Tolumonas osonensis TaxID=675874 RepID=A0A841GDW0_9GAMM|nr:thioredoxin family protein [Tolumonas osonensis]MBB6055777.1 thioredoxin 1 [Tolumonas osonensis]
MSMLVYQETEPSLAEAESWSGPVVIEFGNAWCGFCQEAQPFISAAMAEHPEIKHLHIADGRGKPLGRAFKVKLWPTLICLLNGKEVARVVRPDDTDTVREALAKISTVN